LQCRQPERPQVARLVQLVPIPRSPRPSHGVHITLSARSHEVKRASHGGLAPAGALRRRATDACASRPGRGSCGTGSGRSAC
jgi:hypothetical protein